MSYLKDREIWLSNVPTDNPPAGYVWVFIQNGVFVVRDSNGLDKIMATTTGTVTNATSASYVEYSNVASKPALISGSSQVSYTGLSNIPVGIVSGSSQVTYSGLTGIPSGIVSGSAQVASFGIFATTGSNGFNGSQSITGSLTVTGQVVAQTLNVQQVTSSIVYSSGSNVFGNTLGNTQQFTGSVSVTGSLTVGGVTNIGTRSGGSIRNLNIYGATNSNAIIKIDGADGNGYGAQIDFVSKQTDGTSNTWTLGTGINGGTNAFELYNGSSTSLSINLSGSVGIGTTSQRGVLDISSGLRTGTLSGLFVGADSDTTTGTRTNNTRKIGMIASPHYQNASSSVFGISMDNQVSNNYIFIGGGYSGYNAATAIVFSTGATTTTETGTELMRLTSDGNVGIGITTPFSRLHVRNSDVNEGTIAIGHLQFPGLIYSSANTGDFRIDNRSSFSGFISFYPNGQASTLGSEAMRITSGGNVLIGVTSTPTLSTPNGGKLLMLPNAVIVSGVIAFGSPYTQNIQIDIVYGNWGSNSVIGLVDMIITLREYAHTSGTAFGKIFATNTSQGSTFTSFNTTDVTASQCSITATSGGSYTLRITIDPSNVTDRGSFYLVIPSEGGTASAVSSITVSYV